MTLKYLYTILLVFVFLSVSGQTDREIGFNENVIKQNLIDDGIDKNEISGKLIEIRNIYLQVYNNSKTSISRSSRLIQDDCGNIGFEEGFNNEWCYRTSSREPDGTINQFTNCVNLLPGTGIFNNPDDASLSPILAEELNLSLFEGNFIRLGSKAAGNVVERIEKQITVSEVNRLFSYKYAVVLQSPTHNIERNPYFRIYIEKANGERVSCSEFLATSPTEDGAGIPGFICDSSDCDLQYRPTSINSIDLLNPNYGLNIGDTVTLYAEVADCSYSIHYAYAFFEGSCGNLDNAIVANTGQNGFCINNNVSFSSQQESFGTPSWFVIDPSGNESGPYIVENFDYYFDQLGEHTIRLEIEGAPNNPGNCEIAFTRTVNIIDCDCEECENCSSFSPIPGKKYVVSAWVLEEHPEQQITYTSSAIALQFQYDNGTPLIQSINSFSPSGEIIDGWQRIIGEVTIPEAAQKISINLINRNASINAYFDDIRMHPFNGNMKSFVYDQETQRLMAELDENNYATFYEYDAEGGLVRVKKETANGVYTIQETRSGNSTINN